KELVRLASRRAALTIRQIQSLPQPDKAQFASTTDESLLKLINEGNPGPLDAATLRGLFRELISGARRLVKGVRVVYLGPEYTYTHLAAIERFGSSATLIPVSTISAVFEEVNRNHADYGIAPIENSTDGRIVDTLDMFTRLPLKICGEVQLAIHHNLLARCQRSEVSEIYSKPQALSQCREWLSRNMPQARLVEVTSTTTAAQLARDKPGAAAVASRQAGIQYELQVIAENIEDNPSNLTRFAIIGDEATKPTGNDKTAVLLQIPHKPGSLADALATFKKNNVNLTWIESFPLRGPESGYVFFIDFEGHAGDASTKRMLADLEKKAVRLELLGSYPRSEPID
ncbi:MAG: prephenate dehydratase, partial [Planctomycetota bacterium]|nr:prephenate dehydratase [Planctomycetota bacterium]